MTVVTNRSSTQNRMTDYAASQNPNGGVMMNNFAGPSDTQNFADQNFDEGAVDQEIDDGGETPFMGNHVVKTVRNLRLSGSSQRKLLQQNGEDEQARFAANTTDVPNMPSSMSSQSPLVMQNQLSNGGGMAMATT